MAASAAPNTSTTAPARCAAAGRLERVKTEFNGVQEYSYTRWTYPSSGNKVNQYTTITDGLGEANSFTQTDGLGRPLRQATEHPGSTGGFSTVATEYDALGRPWKQSVPTETDQFTNPAGDDALGYLYREQTFDWKGRPLVTTNTDGTQTEAQYGGCGCAGGEVVTLLGEDLAPPTVPPAPANPPKRRKQVAYSDFLGRTVKTETYNWPAPYGDGLVYSSIVTDYNARDQVRFVKQYAGPAAGTPGLQSETQYDGHGRVWKQHALEIEAGKWTTYVYNTNDTVQSVTDAREAVATYNYNARRLITNITYSSPSGVTATPSASFQYDAVGNRTSVSDASGNVAYTYDQLSRLVMETQSFTGLSGTYHLNYTYSAGGTLTSITDEFNTTINYTHDQVGRLTAVTGAGLPSNATQLSNSIQYRAWGAVKSEAYGNGKTLAMIYDTRLQPVNYNVPGVLGGEYQYYADGALKFMHDLDLTRNGKFDRSYTYDHVGRLYEAKTGKEARGDNGAEGPYRHTYYYDAFNNVNLRDGKHWSAYLGDGWDYYANGRNTEWQYDSDGRIKQQGETLQHTFDAAGELVTSVDSTERGNGTLPRTYLQTYDGLGRAVKRNGAFATYYLKSSALGGRVIAELGSNGQRQTGYIYGNHGLLAKLEPFGAEGPVLRWIHSDAANTREAKTNPAGGSETGKQFDPLGGSVGWADHYQGGLGRGAYTGGFPDDGDPVDFSGGCTLDGVPISCSFAARLVSGASESLCLAGSCGPPRPNASTKVREKPLGKYGEYFSHSEIKRGLFARTGNAVRTDDIGDIKAAGPVLGEVTVKISFDKEIETAQALLNLRVVFETGADLAQRVLEGLKNHPGLREQIEKNIKSGLDLKTILCQAAKESNYQNLSPLPVVLKQNGGNIAVCDCV